MANAIIIAVLIIVCIFSGKSYTIKAIQKNFPGSAAEPEQTALKR